VPPRQIALLVVDVDHTLIDWTRGWAAAARGLLASLAAGGADEAEVVSAWRASIRRHNTMDATAALSDIADALRWPPSRAALRAARRSHQRGWANRLGTLPGVRHGLSRIRRAGCRVVAYTESPAPLTAARLARAGIAEAIDLLVSSTATPECGPTDLALTLPAHARVRRVEIAPWWAKGRGRSLAEIAASTGVTPDRMAVVGDHLEKDIGPACAIGAVACWARYGMRRPPDDQRLIDALCHWHTGGARPAPQPEAHATLTRFDEVLETIEPVRVL